MLRPFSTRIAVSLFAALNFYCQTARSDPIFSGQADTAHSIDPASGFGTPFDLNELASNSLVMNRLLDLNNIQYVRLFDLPGSGTFLDRRGNPILDNWLTSGSGGFDFRLGTGRNMGLINVTAVPEPSSFVMLGLAGLELPTLRRRWSRSLRVVNAEADTDA